MKYEDYKTFRTAIGGKLLEVEIGKVCELANGQAWVKYGDTVVNVTACASKEPRPDIDFFPLSCDYEEKMYAAGKIPGGFIKREGRPSERAVAFHLRHPVGRPYRICCSRHGRSTVHHEPVRSAESRELHAHDRFRYQGSYHDGRSRRTGSS